MALLTAGKALTLIAPFIFKKLVNSMTVASITAPKVVVWKSFLALMLYGASKAFSSVLVQNHVI